MTDALVARDVFKAFVLPTGERLTLLQGLSLSLRAGSSIAVMGRSGSGKSTLLSVVGLLSRPDAGEVVIAGRPTSTLGDRAKAALRNEHIGFVFQSYSLVPHMTTAENVELPLLQGRPMSGRQRRQRVREAMELACISHRAESKPRQLSGGEQQRTAIARALVRSPSLILADEPTGALDTASAEPVLEVLTEAALARGAALLIATHDELVAQRAEEILVLEAGRLVELAPAA
jgi:ABC-type lipoprotein export system ATPase subunit